MKHIATLLTLVLLSGCVSTKNVRISNERLDSFANGTLAVTDRPVPDFADFKPSNAMFGAVGGVASVLSGNEIIRAKKVMDPAIWIRSKLVADLDSKFSLNILDKNRLEVDTSNESKIADTYSGKADFILDIQTVNWSCVYLPLNWNRYRVIYSVKLRLIDVESRKNIAEGFFVWKTPDSYPNPTYKELFSNGAKELSKQLDMAKLEAVNYFRAEILSL